MRPDPFPSTPPGDLAVPRPAMPSTLLPHTLAADFPALPAETVLPTIPGYEVLCELGRGGMGVVYKARHDALKRVVALKMILSKAHAATDLQARFRAEAEAVARLQHPNIVQIYDVGEADGLPFFAEEYVDGGNLASKLRGEPQFPRQAAVLLKTLAETMHAAHQKGVVHRDLKPANVLLTADGQIKVADFGIAKQADTPQIHTATGAVFGTPSYMAPEQAAGKVRLIGPATDVYSLGAILYEMLTGRPPFKGATMLDTLDMVRHAEPVSPTRLQPKVPRDLVTICLKCLQKEPHKRYGNAQLLAEDLRRFLDGESIVARRAGGVERAWKWARRRPTVAGLAAALLAVLLLGVAGIAWKWREAEENAAVAEANAVQSRHAQEEAEKNFAMATDAVDRYLNAVTEDERLQEPELTPLRRQLLETAREFYVKFVSERNNDPNSRRGLGWAYLRLGALASNMDKDHARAAELSRQGQQILEQLLAEKPEDPARLADVAWSHRDLAICFERQEHFPESEAAWEQAIRLQDQVVARRNSIRDRENLAAFLNYLGYLQRQRNVGDKGEAANRRFLAVCESLAAETPDSIPHRYKVAVAHTEIGISLTHLERSQDAITEYRLAIPTLEKLTNEAPADPAIRSLLGDTLRNLAMLERKVVPLDKTLQALQSAIAHQKAALELSPSNRYYRARIQIDYVSLATALIERSDYSAAARAAVESARFRPNESADAFAAVELLEACAALAAADKNATPANRRSAARAIAAESERLLGNAAGYTPRTPLEQNNLAWFLIRSQSPRPSHVARALELIQQAVAAAGDEAAKLGYYNTLGVANYRARDWNAARLALERSTQARKDAGDSFDWYFLAMTYWQLGDTSKAEDYYQRALAWMKTNKPDDEELLQFRQETEVLLGYAAPPASTKPTWALLVDADREAMTKWLERMSATNYVPVFFNRHSRGNEPRAAAIAVSGSGDNPWRVRTDNGVYEFQKLFEQMTADGYWVACLCGFPQIDGPAFTSLWTKSPVAGALCRHNVSLDFFHKEAEQQRSKGNRPVSVSGFTSSRESRFTTVYGPSRDRNWQLRDGLSMERYQATLEEWRLKGYRPASIYVYKESGQLQFGVVFLQDEADVKWAERHGLTAEQIQKEHELLTNEGFRPELIVGYEQDGESRFIGVWIFERPPRDLLATGQRVPELESFDRAMQRYMRERGISAASLGVMKNGKLILARGYGHADKDRKTPVAPDQLFRLASVSKPITAAAIHKLFRDGKLKPDDKVWPLLGLAAPNGQTADPRWQAITIQNLLDHRGGWDRDKAGDPMFQSLEIAKALGKPGPATAEDIIAYMAGQPLQFDPGSKQVYSNFGYCVLGRVIEKVAARSYIDYVRSEVLAPAGITHITLGHTLRTDRDPKEPIYNADGKSPNVMKPGDKELVPPPDGSFHLEAMDAHGGLIGSADELVRFLQMYQIDGQLVGAKPSSRAFFGALPGSFTMLYQRADGVAIAALFNQWHDPGGHDPFEIRRLIDQAADGVERWPTSEVAPR